MVVNACCWAAGLEAALKPVLNTSLVGPYRPPWMGVNKRSPRVKPEDLQGWDTPLLPAP